MGENKNPEKDSSAQCQRIGSASRSLFYSWGPLSLLLLGFPGLSEVLVEGVQKLVFKQ
jgi:hypothetical protein